MAVNRIRIELGSGVMVTFSSKKALTLGQAIKSAFESAKLMNEGEREGLTAKTIQKASAERAKQERSKKASEVNGKEENQS